jgi:hypothetical protein
MGSHRWIASLLSFVATAAALAWAAAARAEGEKYALEGLKGEASAGHDEQTRILKPSVNCEI